MMEMPCVWAVLAFERAPGGCGREFGGRGVIVSKVVASAVQQRETALGRGC